MSKTLRIKLKKVKIEMNGYFKEEEGYNTMEASLIYPAPGTPVVKSIRPLKLKEDEEMVYVGNNLGKLESLKAISDKRELKNELRTFTTKKRIRDNDRDLNKLKKFVNQLIKEEKVDIINFPVKELLFVQKIQNKSYFEVQISAVRQVDKYEKLIINILTTGAKATVKGISGLGAGLTAMVTSSAESLINLFAPEDKSLIIAYGMKEIQEDDNDGEFRIDLFIPSTERIKTPRHYDSYNRIDEFDEKVFKKGDKNGYAVFEISRN